jgi:hypothetical protein
MIFNINCNEVSNNMEFIFINKKLIIQGKQLIISAMNQCFICMFKIVLNICQKVLDKFCILYILDICS